MAISVEDRERYAGARAAGARGAADSSAVTAVRYLPRRDAIELELVSGGAVILPRRAISGLADAPTEALKQLTISAAGDASPAARWTSISTLLAWWKRCSGRGC